MYFETQDKANTFLTDSFGAASAYRSELVRRFGIERCYYEGLQWISNQSGMGTVNSQLRVLPINFNLDTPKLRVTVNQVTRFVIKNAAASHPEKLYVDVLPPESAGTIEELQRAQTLESLLNHSIDDSRYLGVRRDVNFNRCIVGCAGAGLYIRSGKRPIKLGDQQTEGPTKQCIAFEFDPSRLVLDPNVKARSLHDHDYVIYTDVWTKDKIEREYNIKLEEKDLAPIGQLAATETKMAMFSSGRLFSRYQQYSKTPGAIVSQIHMRDSTGRFGCYYVVIQTASGDKKWVNFDNPVSPFGGDGLPLELYHGHRRADSLWSIGDVAMLRDSQDRKNLLNSLNFRIIHKNSGYQMIYDRRILPKGVSEEEFGQRFSNTVAAAIAIDGGRREENRMPPTIMQYPAPNQTVLEMDRQTDMDMREQVFRAEGNFGATKSHVPGASYMAAIEQADQVSGIRVSEDLLSDRILLEVLLGTQVRHVKEASAGTLAMLDRHGFDESDYLEILKTDDQQLGVAISIRESSVRYRSTNQKTQGLDKALGAQSISPAGYRMAMADDLDSPAVASDRMVLTNLRKLIVRCKNGQPWLPMPLGEYGVWAVDMMRQELISAQNKGDELAMQMLSMAIQEQMAADAPPPEPGSQQTGQPQQPEQPATIGELYAQMTG